MKKWLSWLLITLLVAGIMTGCGGGRLTGQGQQDRLSEPQQVALQEEDQDGQRGMPPEGMQGEQEEAREGTQGEAQEETQGEQLAEGLPEEGSGPEEAAGEESDPLVEESGTYTSKEEVALYIHLYGHLPDNYITKRKAEDLGWDSRQGNLAEVAPGKSIGGSRFGNYEGLLPEKEGRRYYECDIDYAGGRRGAKRLVYSDDGLVFYTEDHYQTFEPLYGIQGDGS